MEMTGLPARDLRVLDPLLSYPPTILGRARTIVVNLEHVKAIIPPPRCSSTTPATRASAPSSKNSSPASRSWYEQSSTHRYFTSQYSCVLVLLREFCSSSALFA
ncbi:hypothetical protein ZWY2020_003423 [Hordeum vulgare]|nr:hypothetical protein ZWY2020_003423 [Hordeum vulgare]